MKDNFMICIESLHVGDTGNLQNVSLGYFKKKCVFSCSSRNIIIISPSICRYVNSNLYIIVALWRRITTKPSIYMFIVCFV